MKKNKTTSEIDHSINVRYEPDILLAFNKFIKKWCGSYYPHLIDDDENDGEFMRDKIRGLNSTIQKEREQYAKEFAVWFEHNTGGLFRGEMEQKFNEWLQFKEQGDR